MQYYLAIDIGASGGRHIVGRAGDGGVETQEVYRFPNFIDRREGHLVWDISRLLREVKAGIAAAFAQFANIESLAIDTWGVDYVLMRDGREITPCYAYRDARTEAAIDKVHATLPFARLYERTGIQFQPFNTVYQLYDDGMRGRLQDATDFLMLPEYLGYRLTGVIKKEYTNATTTGLVCAATGRFDMEIVKRLGLPERLFGGLCHPGDTVGALLPEVAAEVGGNTKVVLCASHDTASAFESVDTQRNALLLSSGTWSLLGAKINGAIATQESREANFTNEGGVGYTRFLKNITGLWILSQLRQEFGLSFAQAEALARTSDCRDIFDVNAPDFVAPTRMSGAIQGWFAARGCGVPQGQRELISSAYHSLAWSYRKAADDIERLTATRYDKLYIVGGGAKDGHLNALTADYTQKEVIALPMEATAVGNIKSQMRTGGKIS